MDNILKFNRIRLNTDERKEIKKQLNSINPDADEQWADDWIDNAVNGIKKILEETDILPTNKSGGFRRQ